MMILLDKMRVDRLMMADEICRSFHLQMTVFQALFLVDVVESTLS